MTSENQTIYQDIRSFPYHSPVDSYILKLAAVATMFIDHAASAFMLSFYTPEKWPIYRWLRHIGRFAFPLYCFMLVEGFRYSHNRWKYLRNLFIFALISELPFDLALIRVPIDWNYQNVFWTLALGLLGMMCDVEIIRRGKLYKIPAPVIAFLRVLPMFALAWVAEIAHTDYGAWGVLIIALIYYAEILAPYIPRFFDKLNGSLQALRNPQMTRNLAALCAVVCWFLLYDFSHHYWIESYGLPCIIMILFYNGQRGSYKLSKWFFYAFYPAHLFLLYLLRRLTLGY